MRARASPYDVRLAIHWGLLVNKASFNITQVFNCKRKESTGKTSIAVSIGSGFFGTNQRTFRTSGIRDSNISS